MTRPDKWSEMVLNAELERLSKDYLRVKSVPDAKVIVEKKNGLGMSFFVELDSAKEIEKRMANVTKTLAILKELNTT